MGSKGALEGLGIWTLLTFSLFGSMIIKKLQNVAALMPILFLLFLVMGYVSPNILTPNYGGLK